jgi:hypothetical protein
VEGVARHIRSIGLWQGKARNVVALSERLLEAYDGPVARDLAEIALDQMGFLRRDGVQREFDAHPLPHALDADMIGDQAAAREGLQHVRQQAGGRIGVQDEMGGV